MHENREQVRKGFSGSNVIGISIGVALLAFTAGIGVERLSFVDTIIGKLGVSSNLQGQSDGGLPADLNYRSVEKVYDLLRQNYDGKLSEQDLLDGLKAGLARASGDPYTIYLNDDDAKAFEESLNGEFEGIGAELAVRNEQLQVVAPLADTPAERAGVRAGDPIIAIDGDDTTGITIEQAVTKIRGKKGTKVVLTVVRNNEAKEIPIVRDTIIVPNAEGEILDGNIGYIKLHTFGEDSARETALIAEEFAGKDVKAIVLDLRNNSGGLVDASVDIAGLWLDNKVVLEQRSSGNKDILRSGPQGVLYGIPTVVLINGGSASASEIVAGALQDYGVATIVGSQSFGKGSVQSLQELGDGSQLKVTVARWFTPKGQNIDEDGITPDIKVELTDKDFNANRDPQLDKALEFLRR